MTIPPLLRSALLAGCCRMLLTNVAVLLYCRGGVLVRAVVAFSAADRVRGRIGRFVRVGLSGSAVSPVSVSWLEGDSLGYLEEPENLPDMVNSERNGLEGSQANTGDNRKCEMAVEFSAGRRHFYARRPVNLDLNWSCD